jgi:hypothetical protein
MKLTEMLRRKISPTDIIVLVYIAIQAILVALLGGNGRGYFLLFYLMSAVFVVVLMMFPKPDKPSLLHLVKTAYPLILLYLFYRVAGTEFHLLKIIPRDYFFNALEEKILGTYPTIALQNIMEIWLNELSYLLYITGIILPIWAFLILYRRDRLHVFESFVMATSTACLSCLLIATVVPVGGPESALNNYYYFGIYGNHFSMVVTFFINYFAVGYSSFPAIYFCLLTVAAFYLWDYGKTHVVISIGLLASVFWAGIYLRYHYLLDGLLAAIIAFWAVAVASYTVHRTKTQLP